MPKVSVIIPVYGVERFIERCARSLFEQTLDDMEFIFVDDCTPDNSISKLEGIIAQYPQREGQVRILHHEYNKGLSRARETAINVSKGDFIAHCDSDDWVEAEMYETMYNYAIDGDYDYVKCAHVKTDGKTKNTCYHAEVCNEMTRQNVVSLLLQNKGWNSIWDTLICRDVYSNSNLQFTDNAMFEDFFITSQLLTHAGKIGYIDEPFYNYYINPDSCCNKPDVESYVRRARQAKANVDWIVPYLSKRFSIRQVDVIAVRWGVKNILIPIMDKRENRHYWDEIYPELKCEVYRVGSISLRNKLRFYSAEFNLYKYFKRNG